jgi:hypothetical protein
MNLRIVGGLLVPIGLVLILYRGYTWMTDKPDIDVGAIQLRIGRTAPSNAPLWLGLASIVVGGALVVAGGPKSAA